jgi:acetyltransferase-like isoleucine patch superfamily enzyme
MRKIEQNEIVRRKLSRARKSPAKAYMDFSVGNEGFGYFLKYEILNLFLGSLPGSFGLFFRKMLYPSLLKKVGKGVIIGRSVVFRHPRKIEIGNNVTIDDYCLIDARGSGDEGVVLEDEVILNRNCCLNAKTGSIKLGKRTSLGSYSSITSMERVEFGEAVLTGGGCYFSSGSYSFSDPREAIMDQDIYSKGEIRIGAKSYFGARASVVGGVKIGEGAVIGACSLVMKNVAPGSIVGGVPAKVLKTRDISFDEAIRRGATRARQ